MQWESIIICPTCEVYQFTYRAIVLLYTALRSYCTTVVTATTTATTATASTNTNTPMNAVSSTNASSSTSSIIVYGIFIRPSELAI